jgi:N-acetylglucosamine kinase-like BadF-type ATPase
MKLIADSGGTKTDWRLIGEFNTIHQAKTDGLNPYFLNEKEMVEILKSDPLQMFPAEEIEEVVFYGSGCSGDIQIARMQNVLSEVYSFAHVHVEHDLLGAARAICGKNEGIAVILGTGANTCSYNGKHIVSNIPSLGYVLGDEGSGADLGEALLTAFCLEKIPDHLDTAFRIKYGHGRDSLLQNIYSEPFPNRFLAGFTHFLSKNMDDPWIKNLVYQRFELLFKNTIIQYPNAKNVPVGFVGSIAFYFSRYLRDIAESFDIQVGQILETPIAALTLFHMNDDE